MDEQRIIIISPFFNAKKYIFKCIDSVISQDYNNYHHFLIDDNSTDDTLFLVKDYINKLPINLQNKITILHNDINVGAVCNQIITIKHMLETESNNSIIMLLDGDDWLINDPNIFKFYDDLYDQNTEFTYGSCWSVADNIPLIAQEYPPHIKKTKNYRIYKFNWGMPYTHLRTFRRYLVLDIPNTAFMDTDKKWFKAGGDNATFYNILEKANPNKVKVVSQIVYNYNDINELNDYKINQKEQELNTTIILKSKERSKYSIVIPTMWRCSEFLVFLSRLVENEYVDEIIIIDNDGTNRPNHPTLKNKKIKFHDFGKNIYVNPAWNFGVKVARNNKVCIINDDIEFDLSVFEKIDPYYDNTFGVIGWCPGVEEFEQPPITTGQIEVIPWKNHHTYGFGCLMFVDKTRWIDIPQDLKIYFGDNFIFDYNLHKGFTNYLITNMKSSSFFAKTTSDLSITSGFLEKEYEAFNMIRANNFTQDIIELKYIEALNTNSDINEHLPILKKLANECKSVTEFGVRSGNSTKAFLSTNVKLKSYDLFKDVAVEELFQYGKSLGKDIDYIIADDLKIEIDETDLLFIDTDHTYNQLYKELMLHHSKVRKYIVLHDTFTYGTSADGGLLSAIIDFMIPYPEWKFKYHTNNNNGLTVLERNTKSKLKKVLIGIPTAKYIESDTFKSIYDLIIPDDVEVTYQHFYGYNIDQVRNLIADWTVNGFDYLFSVDSDIVLPNDSLIKLLSHDKDVVSGMYIQRIENTHNLELYDFDGTRLKIKDLLSNKDTLIKIGSCGFGCVLVKKEVLKFVGYPQFVYQSAIDHKDTKSEDTYFCTKAKEHGYGIWVDTSIRCKHVGNKYYVIED